MAQERRVGQRVRAYRPVRLHQFSAVQAVETLSKDLGAGGMRCISTTIFPVASEVKVEMMLGTGEEPMRARGRLVWFRAIPHSDQFDLGISFQAIDDESKRRLSACLDRLSALPPPISGSPSA